VTDWRIDDDDKWPLTEESEVRTKGILQTHNILILEKCSDAWMNTDGLELGLSTTSWGGGGVRWQRGRHDDNCLRTSDLFIVEFWSS
jgi:hypothetical protein